MRSLAFDHAVSFYDKTRALPGWVSRAVTDSIVNLVTFHRRDPQAPNRKLRRRLFELAKEQGVDHSSRRNDRAGKEWMMPTRHFGFGDPPTTKVGTGLPRTGEYEIRLTSDARNWNCR